MKFKLLIIPGYIVGIGSLFILSYRTVRAFLSESKSITIHVNRFGEQYLDLIFLGILWSICMISLVYLYIVVKEGRRTTILDSDIKGKKVMSKDGSYLGIWKSSLYDAETGAVRSVIVEPSEEFNTMIHRLDDRGNLVVSVDSVKIAKDKITLIK